MPASFASSALVLSSCRTNALKSFTPIGNGCTPIVSSFLATSGVASAFWIAAFIREHPASVADERVKARVVDGMDNTPVRPEEVRAASALLDLLAPAAAPDDSYVRWLKVRGHVSGEREPLAGLLASGDALRQSALVLYGGYDLPRELGVRRVKDLKRDLTAAAEQTVDEEARDFIREAADAISLGDPDAGVYAAPR